MLPVDIRRVYCQSKGGVTDYKWWVNPDRHVATTTEVIVRTVHVDVGQIIVTAIAKYYSTSKIIR